MKWKMYAAVVCFIAIAHVDIARGSRDTEMVRHRYAQLFTGGDFDKNDPDVKAWLRDNDALVLEDWNSMDHEGKQTYVWKDCKDPCMGGCVAFRRLADMANAYACSGSEYYKNEKLKKDIILGLEVLIKYWSLPEERGNWWQFQIGTPNEIGKCLVLMWDELSPELRQKYLASLKVHGPKAVGDIYSDKQGNFPGDGNRAWLFSRTFIEAALADNDADCERLSKQVIQTNFLKYTPTAGLDKWSPGKGGFYPDGSHIGHGFHPYIGGYGTASVDFMARLIYMTEGTRFAFTPEKKQLFAQMVRQSAVPFIYKGKLMEAVVGRLIAHPNYQRIVGHVLIDRMLAIREALSPNDAKEFDPLLKYWGQTDSSFFQAKMKFVDGYGDFHIYPMVQMKKVMRDQSISAATEPAGHFRFPIQDRVVHRRPGFSFTIAMHDDVRIINAETSSSQNREGRHTSDGMTYLYNNEVRQFEGDFWATVDRQRMPGITVKRDHYVPVQLVNGSKWVGGVDLDRTYGIAGMDLAPGRRLLTPSKTVPEEGNTLTARKSWFMFDDEVVAMGSGISAADGAAVETVVENRRMTNPYKVSLLVNGEKSDFSTNEVVISGVNWMHLDVGVSGAETGYYFPKTTSLKALREKRAGNWFDNVGNFTPKGRTPCTEEYLTFWFNHGVDPKQATYAYVLLPGKSIADVKAYTEHPRIEIIENSPEAQAVKHPALNITGVNFWNDAVKKVAFITVDKKASVMVREAAGRIDLAVSDPTQFNKGEIQIELDRAAEKVISNDANIEVKQMRPTIKLSVKVGGLCGATSRISLDAKGQQNQNRNKRGLLEQK